MTFKVACARTVKLKVKTTAVTEINSMQILEMERNAAINRSQIMSGMVLKIQKKTIPSRQPH